MQRQEEKSRGWTDEAEEEDRSRRIAFLSRLLARKKSQRGTASSVNGDRDGVPVGEGTDPTKLFSCLFVGSVVSVSRTVCAERGVVLVVSLTRRDDVIPSLGIPAASERAERAREGVRVLHLPLQDNGSADFLALLPTLFKEIAVALSPKEPLKDRTEKQGEEECKGKGVQDEGGEQDKERKGRTDQRSQPEGEETDATPSRSHERPTAQHRHENKAGERAVLVHCMQGMSRSVAACLAVVMAGCGVSLQTASCGSFALLTPAFVKHEMKERKR
uniref:Tyrosine specific protein phosphatases domain-containing protein n=1 Tax=Chromera velia CCMP2878 TaxID=1169474 RepID=A0A0G4I562_9ALVE|eukprot:Cvel_11064.t1-p1 / transcript=Cvel_11064.t1 / gene=Cvel_11064 / organism=Chromera_velia_CCMP2878 / gene_product=hypothetical protein / transcript_product=hypothetical protein / location=Cvel_scaffold683:557-3485(+) / protein_length=273 / sequence_SO=supercontig / SO=protein_coding / is_pseudo=false